MSVPRSWNFSDCTSSNEKVQNRSARKIGKRKNEEKKRKRQQIYVNSRTQKTKRYKGAGRVRKIMCMRAEVRVHTPCQHKKDRKSKTTILQHALRSADGLRGLFQVLWSDCCCRFSVEAPIEPRRTDILEVSLFRLRYRLPCHENRTRMTLRWLP